MAPTCLPGECGGFGGGEGGREGSIPGVRSFAARAIKGSGALAPRGGGDGVTGLAVTPRGDGSWAWTPTPSRWDSG